MAAFKIAACHPYKHTLGGAPSVCCHAPKLSLSELVPFASQLTISNTSEYTPSPDGAANFNGRQGNLLNVNVFPGTSVQLELTIEREDGEGGYLHTLAWDETRTKKAPDPLCPCPTLVRACRRLADSLLAPCQPTATLGQELESLPPYCFSLLDMDQSAGDYATGEPREVMEISGRCAE